jgi:hypothetical protein
MSVEPLFIVAMLLALVVGFAMSAGSLGRRNLPSVATRCSTPPSPNSGFTVCGQTGGPRIRGIGRQDVYLLCIKIRLPGGLEGGARACAAWVCGCLNDLLPCGKHSSQRRSIIHQ